MATIILIVIYVAFLGRGMPDFITGSAWTMMSAEFGVPDSYLSFITVTISLATAVTSLFSARLIKKFGTYCVAGISLFALALTIFGYYLSNSFILLCILAVPLGCFAGVIDNALNDYMANHYKAMYLNIMHGVYGFGAALSPLLISLALSKTGDWRVGYLMSFFVITAIALIFGLSKPFWGKRSSSSQTQEQTDIKTFSLKSQLRDKKVWLVCACVFFTNAIEAVFSAYGNTYLVSGKGLSEIDAPKIIMCFCLCMGLGRMFSGFLTIKLSNRMMLIGYSSLLVIPAVLLFFNVPVIILYILFGLLGFINGPIYPLILYLTPDNFGKDRSASIMGTEIAVAYTGFVVSQFLFSLLINWFSINAFPIFAIGLTILMFVFIFLADINHKKGIIYNRAGS